MKAQILLLGNPELYEISKECSMDELPQIKNIRDDLHDTLIAFRKQYGIGRAIAAPQIGIKKRIIYRYLDTPILFINPRIEFPDDETMEVWDDCMSFPGLQVKIMRYKRCIIYYKDEDWNDCELRLQGDMSELLQHEYDHLDGILATMRAIDNKSFALEAAL
jgi:peptide deformylase